MKEGMEAAQPTDAAFLPRGGAPRRHCLDSGIRTLLFMTVPFVLLVIVFSYAPLWGWGLAFIDYYPGVPVLESPFVGLKYFVRMFSNNREFIMVMRNTLALSLLQVLVTPLPVVLALMLNEARSRPFRRTIQTLSSFPYFISWIIVYSVFFAFLSVDDGMINRLLLKTGLLKKPSDLLGSARATWALQTVISLWKNGGYTAIIYLAAIAGIDPELYDAAEVDGAGALRKIAHITIPGILPTYSIMLVLTVSNILSNGFEQYYIFHNALNHDMIEVLDTYVYRIGLVNLDFSLSTAVGMFKTVVSITMFVLANSISKRLTGSAVLS